MNPIKYGTLGRTLILTTLEKLFDQNTNNTTRVSSCYTMKEVAATYRDNLSKN